MVRVDTYKKTGNYTCGGPVVLRDAKYIKINKNIFSKNDGLYMFLANPKEAY